MEVLKIGRDFFQNEVLGMKWLNSLIGSIVEAIGLDPTSRIGGSVQFFFYVVNDKVVSMGKVLKSSEVENC